MPGSNFEGGLKDFSEVVVVVSVAADAAAVAAVFVCDVSDDALTSGFSDPSRCTAQGFDDCREEEENPDDDAAALE